MDYKKKYNEALAKAKDMLSYKEVRQEDIEYLFPELQESEDEKIRERLKHYLEVRRCQTKDNEEYINCNHFLKWLEKQGEIDLEHYKDGENEKRKFVGYGFLKCKGDFLSFKEGETYWLEYVGNDNYNVRSDNLLGQTFHIKPVELYTVFRPTTWLEKQNCVKNTDKIEPKFKVGDLIKHNKTNIIRKVISVNSGSYYVENIETSGRIELFNAEQNFHLWTLQDAKDGDVLATFAGAFIYNGNNGGGSCPGCYCGINTLGNFQLGVEHHWTSKSTHPATKEQRELLFQKMHESGYEWYADKKELKKLSNEDELIRKDVFVEKACQFIQEHHHEFYFWDTEEYALKLNTQKFIEDFKKYMKGGEK